MNHIHCKIPGVLCTCFCQFVCLGFIDTLKNVSLIWRRHHYRWRAANFGLDCLAFIAFEQWLFFSVPHPLWHRESVYNGHFHLLMSVEQRGCLCQFYDLDLSRLGFEHPKFRLRGQRSNPVCQRRGTYTYECPQIVLPGYSQSVLINSQFLQELS